MFGEIQPAVKKETKKVIIYTLTGIVLMWIVFAVLHGTMPEKVPFDYTVICPHETESQLFSENASSAGLGHSRYYCSLFSVCCRTFTASVPFHGDQAECDF